MCLAKVLVYSFLDISILDVEDSIEYIHKMADSILTQRIEITNINSGGLSIRLLEEDEADIDYIDQLDKLELEDETKWNIYKVLLRFKAVSYTHLEDLNLLSAIVCLHKPKTTVWSNPSFLLSNIVL